MPTAYTPTEGRKIIGELIFNQANDDRGTELELGLMINTTGIDEDTVLGDIDEPTGGGYARITLADASWTVSSAGVCEYAKQVFSATGSAYSDDITGFFIASTGTAPKLINVQVEDAPVAVDENESYSVTPRINITGGGA